jgi:chaperonin GroES
MAKEKVVAKKAVITPLGDRVLIEEVRGDTKTMSGIILPDSLTEEMEMKRGVVVAVGPGRISDGERISVTVKKGDEVLFKKWADKIKLDGREYYIAGEHDLVATITN